MPDGSAQQPDHGIVYPVPRHQPSMPDSYRSSPTRIYGTRSSSGAGIREAHAVHSGNLDDRKRWGRDHHPYAALLAGGGVRAGLSYGETDDLGMNVVRETGSCLRLPGHHWAWITNASRPVPGPRIPTDRHPWPGRPRNSGVRTTAFPRPIKSGNQEGDRGPKLEFWKAPIQLSGSCLQDTAVGGRGCRHVCGPFGSIPGLTVDRSKPALS